MNSPHRSESGTSSCLRTQQKEGENEQDRSDIAAIDHLLLDAERLMASPSSTDLSAQPPRREKSLPREGLRTNETRSLHMMLCPKCHFWRDGLRVLPCCSMKLCAECALQMSSCPNCNVAMVVSNEEYKPYKVLVDSIMRKCRHPGCGHQATDVLIAAHESEVVAAMGDAVDTPQARELRIKANLQKLKPPRVVTETSGKHYVEHLVLRTDTLVGLSMKYAVPTKDIQRANHLATGNIHERSRLRIPFTADALPAENDEEVTAALRRLALSKFKGATGLKENEEANFYLDSAEYDLPKAVAAYREDLAWDHKRNPNSLNSCVKRLASTPTPSEAPSISTPANAAITPSSFSPHPAACYVGCPPPTYDFTDTTTADTTHPRRPRPNLLQELFCFCFFSPRTRR